MFKSVNYPLRRKLLSQSTSDSISEREAVLARRLARRCTAANAELLNHQNELEASREGDLLIDGPGQDMLFAMAQELKDKVAAEANLKAMCDEMTAVIGSEPVLHVSKETWQGLASIREKYGYSLPEGAWNKIEECHSFNKLHPTKDVPAYQDNASVRYAKALETSMYHTKAVKEANRKGFLHYLGNVLNLIFTRGKT